MEQESLMLDIEQLLSSRRLLNVYGKSGAGKTSLVLYLAGQLLTKELPYHYQCVWIQASEFFPSRRLSQLFEKDFKKLRFLRNNIFITPFRKPFLSYKAQVRFFSTFVEKLLPPELKIIVIDNISHHLRFKLAQYSSINEKVRLLNHFYEEQLLPLITFCQKQDFILVLIHEVSYNPKLGRIVPFFHKLYSRIETVDIFLEQDITAQHKILNLTYLDYHKQVGYQIQNDGFQWISIS